MYGMDENEHGIGAEFKSFQQHGGHWSNLELQYDKELATHPDLKNLKSKRTMLNKSKKRL